MVVSFETFKLLVLAIDVRIGSKLVFFRLTLVVTGDGIGDAGVELNPDELLPGDMATIAFEVNT